MSYLRLSSPESLWLVALIHVIYCISLASAAVGTLEPRSLVEPIRKIIARVHGHYLQAKAVDIDMFERIIEVNTPTGEENFYVP